MAKEKPLATIPCKNKEVAWAMARPIDLYPHEIESYEGDGPRDPYTRISYIKSEMQEHTDALVTFWTACNLFIREGGNAKKLFADVIGEVPEDYSLLEAAAHIFAEIRRNRWR